MIPNLAVLGSLVTDLYQGLSQLFYIMLPLTILFSVVFGYLKSGDPNYPDVIKRAFVAALLLTSFPEVSNIILDICDGIALKIDNMSGLETFMRMAQEKSQSYATAKNVLLLKFDDLFMAVLSFGSFLLLLLARYITIALYYFYWVLLSICAPLMILCYIFPKIANITTNLYKGLIEVACWKILWASAPFRRCVEAFS
ncbi:MAG: type IV secretion system protein [Bdellovibrionaceae bacterium]|nr:type IV secretion system protein [Pseudobdellovibrionaceae bacterium]